MEQEEKKQRQSLAEMLEYAGHDKSDETDFETSRRRSCGIYVPKNKVEKWVKGRKTHVEMPKSG